MKRNNQVDFLMNNIENDIKKLKSENVNHKDIAIAIAYEYDYFQSEREALRYVNMFVSSLKGLA
jgi:hypothetical protein